MVQSMKTLASRNLGLIGKTGVAKAIAVAAPMVLLECHSGIQAPAPVPVTVVTIGPQPAFDSAHIAGRPAAMPSANTRSAEKAQRTELDVQYYEGCVLRARLSVIRPDGSLDRIILDPKVNFDIESPGSGMKVAVCRGSEECDVSKLAGASGGTYQAPGIIATFVPVSGSGLLSASASVALQGPEPERYCP